MITYRATIWFFTSMRTSMYNQITFKSEFFTAKFTGSSTTWCDGVGFCEPVKMVVRRGNCSLPYPFRALSVPRHLLGRVWWSGGHATVWSIGQGSQVRLLWLAGRQRGVRGLRGRPLLWRTQRLPPHAPVSRRRRVERLGQGRGGTGSGLMG